MHPGNLPSSRPRVTASLSPFPSPHPESSPSGSHSPHLPPQVSLLAGSPITGHASSSSFASDLFPCVVHEIWPRFQRVSSSLVLLVCGGPPCECDAGIVPFQCQHLAQFPLGTVMRTGAITRLALSSDAPCELPMGEISRSGIPGGWGCMC